MKLEISIWNLSKWLTRNNRYQYYQRMTWQGWCWITKVNLKGCWKLWWMTFVTWFINLLIHQFSSNALELELHISITENAMHMSNIREGSVWTYQAFLVVSTTLLWKKLFWTYFQKLMPLSNLQTLKIVIALSWPVMPLKILPWNCQNEKIYIECQKLTLALKMLPLLKLVYLLASSICFQPKLVQVFKFLWSKLKKR